MQDKTDNMKILISSRKNGFTLIEMIMALVVIGIVAAISLSRFVAIQDRANQNAELSTAGAIRSGIYNYYLHSQVLNRDPQYPPALDTANNGPASSVNPFFSNVCSMSMVYDWEKTGLSYTGPAGAVYTYYPDTGRFESGLGLLYQWSMEEGAGGSIGEGDYLGQIHGNVQWQEGKVGTALNFKPGQDGLGGFAQVPDADVLDLTDAGTVEAWIYADSLVRNQGAGIVHKGDEENFSDEAYSLQFWTGNTIAMLVNNGSKYELVRSTVDLVPNQWYHVVGTWDSTGMKVYLNGELNNSNTKQVVAQSSAGPLNIGAQLSQRYNPFYQNLPFDGSIDEVKVHDRALSIDEIKAYYNSTK